MARLFPVLLLVALACAGARPENLGVHQGELAPCPDSPNCVSTQGQDEAHRVAPFVLAESPAEAWEAAKRAVAGLPRTKIVSESDGYLHAEWTSALMGYVDDLELALDSSQGEIEVRSASRVGYGDRGVNRARVEALREALVSADAIRSEAR